MILNDIISLTSIHTPRFIIIIDIINPEVYYVTVWFWIDCIENTLILS